MPPDRSQSSNFPSMTGFAGAGRTERPRFSVSIARAGMTNVARARTTMAIRGFILMCDLMGDFRRAAGDADAFEAPFLLFVRHDDRLDLKRVLDRCVEAFDDDLGVVA